MLPQICARGREWPKKMSADISNLQSKVAVLTENHESFDVRLKDLTAAIDSREPQDDIDIYAEDDAEGADEGNSTTACVANGQRSQSEAYRQFISDIRPQCRSRFCGRRRARGNILHDPCDPVCLESHRQCDSLILH